MAIIANLYIDQGTDFSVTVDVTDSAGDVLNLSGYTADAQIRKLIVHQLSVRHLLLVFQKFAGQVTLTLTDTQTTALSAGRYVYDLNIESSGGSVTRVIEGQAIVTPGVTRS